MLGRGAGWILLLAATLCGAQTPPAPSATLLTRGLDHFYNLEYDAAIGDFRQMVAAQPHSAAAWNHLSQAELYREMYRIGALESQLYGHGDAFFDVKLLPPDPAAVQVFLHDNSTATQLATAAVQAHPQDAHAHYDLAVAWALHGTLEFSVQKSYWGALGDAKNARREAERAVALDPNFVDPELILGVHNYVAGSLPWAVKMMSTLVGYSGDKELGRRQIAGVIAHGEHARTDAAVMLAVVDRRDGLNQQSAPILQRLQAEYPRNVLFAVETAEAWEAAGDHDAARAQFQSILDHAARQDAGFAHAPLDRIWYELGNIERLYSHWSLAASDYQKAESAPRAQPRYEQAAALAAGETDQQSGDATSARQQFEHCVEIDPDSSVGKAAARYLAH